MSKFIPSRILIILGCFISFLVSCNDEVDLYTDSLPVPVVYCLLDQADSIQHIRLGRSYQAGANSAEQTPEADSTVWNIPHQVYIEEYSGDSKLNTYFFEPDTTIRKDTGFFPTANLRIFSAPLKPMPGYTYQLYVYFPDLRKMVSGRITVHNLPEIVDPLPLSIRSINFEPGQLYTVRWYPGLNTGVYELIFRVHYRDSSAGGQEFRSADYTSKGIFDLKTDQLQEYSMGGPAFFKAMASQIPVVDSMLREVISLGFVMITGGTDLGFLYRSAVETGSAFTNLAEYSGLRNGIGIFSSRTETRVPNLTLSEVTIDMLAHSEGTKSLGFKDSKGN